MTLSEFKVSNVIPKSNYERDVERADGIISNRRTLLKEITHKGLGAIYVKIVFWSKDELIEVRLSKKTESNFFDPLTKIKFLSKNLKADPYTNLFRLHFLSNHHQKIDHTIQTLQTVTKESPKQYFEKKYIELLGHKRVDKSLVLLAKHQNSSYDEIAEIYLVSILIPFCQNNVVKVRQIIESQESLKRNQVYEASKNSFKQNFLAFCFVAVFFSGCYTLITRKKVGANCGDGTKSYSTGSGSCSHHGGVVSWRYEYWWDK